MTSSSMRSGALFGKLERFGRSPRDGCLEAFRRSASASGSRSSARPPTRRIVRFGLLIVRIVPARGEEAARRPGEGVSRLALGVTPQSSSPPPPWPEWPPSSPAAVIAAAVAGAVVVRACWRRAGAARVVRRARPRRTGRRRSSPGSFARPRSWRSWARSSWRVVVVAAAGACWMDGWSSNRGSRTCPRRPPRP